MVAWGACSRTDLAYPSPMSIETAAQLAGALADLMLGVGGFGGLLGSGLGRLTLALALLAALGRAVGLGVELGEELIGGGLALALAAPHHAAAPVIADHRQVAVALSPRDLVDRDLKQTAEPVAVDQLLPDTLDDPPDRLPVDPRQPAGRGLVGLRRQPRDQVLEVAGEPRAVAGERDALHVRAVLGAAHPPEPGVNLQPPAPEIEMAPDRVVMLPALPMARGVRALRAMQATPAQRDRHDDSIRLEADRADPHPRQANRRENAVETRMAKTSNSGT